MLIEHISLTKTVTTGLFDEHFNDDNPSTSWVWVDNSHFKFAKFEYGARVGQSE